MEVNEYKFHELNIASKAIIEKLQQLAIEKHKLEEAIKAQKLKEEQLKSHSQVSPFNRQKNKINFETNPDHHQSVEASHHAATRNHSQCKAGRSSDVSKQKCSISKKPLHQQSVGAPTPPIDYGKFKDNYSSFISKQSVTNLADSNIDSGIQSIKQQYRHETNKLRSNQQQSQKRSSYTSFINQKISTTDKQQPKQPIQQQKAEQQVPDTHKAIPSQLSEIQTDFNTIQPHQSQITVQTTSTTQHIVSSICYDNTQFQKIKQSIRCSTAQDSASKKPLDKKTIPSSKKTNIIVYSKVAQINRDRSLSKKVGYNEKMKNSAAKSNDGVSKQFQALRKFEKDSKTRRDNRFSYQSTQRGPKPSVGNEVKLKQQLEGFNNFSLSRCQNFVGSNMTTAKKPRKTVQSTLASDQKCKRKGNKQIINVQKEDKIKDIWGSLCQDDEYQYQQNEVKGRNLLEQFKTLEAAHKTEISPQPSVRASRGGLSIKRPPSAQLKKQPSINQNSKNIDISSTFHHFSSVNNQKQIYTSKPQSSRFEIEQNDDDLSQHSLSVNLNPFQIQCNQDQNLFQDNASSIYLSPNRDKGSLQRSTMSVNTQQSSQQFKARPFKDQTNFVVKKSTKVLTVPEDFNFNTDKRSLSKNSRQNTLERSDSKNMGSLGSLSNRCSNIMRSKTRKNSILDQKRRNKVNEGTADEQVEGPSLLEKLIKEYDLENVFKFAKDQIDKKTFDFSGTLNSIKIEDCYSIPKQ